MTGASHLRSFLTACLATMMLGLGMLPALAAPPTQDAPNLPDSTRIDSWQQTILARPLFSPTRRPADMPGTGDTTPRLTGIVVGSGRRRAIFMIPGQDRGQIADVGDLIGPWRIVAIENGTIRVRDMAGEHVMRPDRDRRTDNRMGDTPPAPAPSRPENQ
ncbi:hypothetical protein ACMAUO_13730 [Gluconacetobacter sp. Hr-1-5]|uniref:hypothetical protein n=1 Tax=Gluconacetobacter sp. Hr-1-5 TaxID=3395370 RepID=UPI003B52DE08